MLTSGKELKQKLASDDLVIGMMATDHAWPFLVEICQNGGLDYLVIDCEHGSFSDELVAHICQVGRLAGFPVLVRAISCEKTVVRRIIDLGPCGILLPCVESVEDLDQVREAIQMPPRGRRRPGGMGNYWVDDHNYTTWKTDLEDHFIVIPQVESKLGVDRAEELAAHPIVTALGLGPYDLSADLGCCWNPENPEFIRAHDQVKTAADSVGKKVWAGCDCVDLRNRGYTFLWIGTVTSVMTQALAGTVSKIRSGEDSDCSSESAPPPA